ncbi:Tyrosine-protein kinase YwqD [Roseovarius litorisediminis]|uniref:Tyrosine-protein kinase YwqD n=1 Tax=Roseovarius litorisediminis TaxID=1312363 RepID=A0A1Y5SWW0_9RHOB|nr:CpsD/CapB family tyrosine-protein kinase [Roseovarius litorisediminis]SLN46906.1 Tyrosine-protein kinase YwqD [Roseovarius litorisediminis]
MERIQSAIEKARKARTKAETRAKGDRSVKAAEIEAVPADQTLNSQHSVSAQEDAERNLAWQKIKQLKLDDRHLQISRIVAHKSCQEANPYDVLRTKLLQQMNKNGWKRVAITSPTAGCGKSTICANIAFSLARYVDFRVMVVELDLRRPSLKKIIGLAEKHQFSQVLKESDVAENHMVRIGENLIFATNSSSVSNAAELLQSVGAASVLDKLEATYRPNIVIFDTAPILTGDDTLEILDQVDCALLVAEAESSRSSEIDKCEHDLSERTNCAGIVLNKCRYMDRGDSYYYSP